MKRAGIMAAVIVAFSWSGGGARAGLVFYPDRATFDAANPGLPVEGFENANSAGNPTFTGPLDSTSNDGVFTPGSILPGIQFNQAGGNQVDGLYLASPNQNGLGANPTNALGINTPPTDFDILLNPGVTAFGLNLFQNKGGGGQTGTDQDYTVNVFGTGGLLGSEVVTVPSGGSGFFGVSSTDPGAITEVTVGNSNRLFNVIDNVAFGTPAVTGVPEPATVVSAGLAVLMGLGYARLRRRSAA